MTAGRPAAAEVHLPELPARYNAAETFIDAHRGVRADRVAIRCRGVSVTYRELGESVDRCANALRALGVEMEQRIVVHCADSPAFVYAFFGAIKLGAVPIPTNPLLVASDLAYILRDSRAVAVVATAGLEGKALGARASLPRLRHVLVTGGPAPDGALSFEDALAAADTECAPADTTPDDAAFWLYSSGTTGFPKGAVHLQHDMIWCAETYGRHILGMTEDDRHFTVSPLFHAYGLGNGVFYPLRVGASTVYKPERATPELVYSIVT
ncbi:MAG TPA: AMP-binding protein, partial [Candidatus Limnocylindria bacterium]|nr:AMP-binding protein [Candidatus Limnocylindria bacterium]